MNPDPEAPRPEPRELDPAALSRDFRAVRGASEALCEPLSDEDCALQSMEDASPAKWHLAHTTWFFETFVLRELDDYPPYDEAFEFLFNSYYNTIGEQHPRPQRGLVSRPTRDEVLEYRRYVDAEMLQRLDGMSAETLAVSELGLHHEQQHQELLLTDLKHLFSHNPLDPTYQALALGSVREVKPLAWHYVPPDTRFVGAGAGGFAFDNERPRHRVWVDGFELASRLVTNAEFLAFIEDNGYARPELWLSDGWIAAERERWRAPLYWRERNGGWTTFTLGGRRDVREDEPVCHVSFYEADAYARWACARLATEQEWEVAASALPVVGNFVESGLLHPAAAGSPGEAPGQLFGDVWEWTESAYRPYPGYRPASGSIGEYNGKFMCNQMVLRGGSCATPRSHARATYRNFFFPWQRWQFTGIRLARDVR